MKETTPHFYKATLENCNRQVFSNQYSNAGAVMFRQKRRKHLGDHVKTVDGGELVLPLAEINFNALEISTCRVENHGVNKGGSVRLTLLVGLSTSLLDDSSLHNIDGLLDNVQVDQTAVTFVGVGNGIKLFCVLGVDITDVSEPHLKRGNEILIGLGGSDSSALVVTTDNDVLNLQISNTVLKGRKKVGVGVDNHVGNVTVDEDVSGFLSHDDIRRDTGIGTSY
jgi:hypothetical protein